MFFSYEWNSTWKLQVKKFPSIYIQENSYPLTTNFYKSGLSEPESTSYYQDSHGYEVNHHEPLMDEYIRPSEVSAQSMNICQQYV